MQILKPFLLVCVGALPLLPLFSHAADTDTQAKAREALRSQLDGATGTQSNLTAPAASPSAPAVAPATPQATPKKSRPPAKPKPEAKKKAEKVPKPVLVAKADAAPVTHKADSDAIAQAREDMRRAISEGAPQQPPNAAPPAKKNKSKPEPKEVAKPAKSPKPVKQPSKPAPVATETKVAPAPDFQPLPDSTAPAAKAAPAQKPSKEPKKAKAASPEKANKQADLKAAPPLQPMPSPALPIASDKQQRLSDLLRKYQADALTPEQYHQQRAKILAEP